MLSNTLLLHNFYILIAVLRKRWNLKEIEKSNIVKAIDGEDLSFLVEAKETDSDFQKSKMSEYTIILEYAMKWNGSHYMMAKHLQEAGFKNATMKYV